MTQKRNEENIPVYRKSIVLIAGVILIALSIGMYAGVALENTVYKPKSWSLTYEETPLNIRDMDWNYEGASDRWSSVDLELENTGGLNISADIQVYIYDSGDNQIASGIQNTGQITSGGIVQKTVTITWNSGKNNGDAYSARITVVQD